MSTPTGVLFSDPQAKPLSTTGQPQAGAYYLFYLTGTTTPANVYADGLLATPLSQVPGTSQPSCTADSGGRFNPIYLDPSTIYRVQLYTAAGSKLEDTDPYIPTLTQAIFNKFLSGVAFTGGALDSDTGNAYFHRTASYSGGTVGFVNTALTVQTDVTGTNAQSDEWPLLALLHNYANGVGSENVAFYAQGNKHGTAFTWGAVIEVIEVTPTDNPPLGTIGLELDIDCNGTDNSGNGSRVGLDLAIRQNQSLVGAGHPYAQVNWGYRIQNGGVVGNNVGFGFALDVGMIANICFDSSHGTCTTAALQLAQGQTIIFDGPNTQHNSLSYNGAGLDYEVSNTTQVRLMSTGGIAVNLAGVATQVVGPRNTGWSAFTGTLNNASVYDTSSVNLVQLAQRVAAIQNALTTHGLLGT